MERKFDLNRYSHKIRTIFGMGTTFRNETKKIVCYFFLHKIKTWSLFFYDSEQFDFGGGILSVDTLSEGTVPEFTL